MAPFWHRKPYFSILNLSVFHLADKFTNNSFLRVQKNPGNLTVPGHLTLGHNVPNGTQYILNKDVILINDYSMIVATRPDPTVRPPSRIANVRPWLIAIG